MWARLRTVWWRGRFVVNSTGSGRMQHFGSEDANSWRRFAGAMSEREKIRLRSTSAKSGTTFTDPKKENDAEEDEDPGTEWIPPRSSKEDWEWDGDAAQMSLEELKQRHEERGETVEIVDVEEFLASGDFQSDDILEEEEDEDDDEDPDTRRVLDQVVFGDDTRSVVNIDYDEKDGEGRMFSGEANDDDDDLFDEEIQDLIEEDEELVRMELERAFGREGQRESRREDGHQGTRPDWLRTRREKLGQEEEDQQDSDVILRRRVLGMKTPQEAAAAKEADGEIPVIMHTLLSEAEIRFSLEALGGKEVIVLRPSDERRKSLLAGAKALIVVTGTSFSHIRLLADSLVRNLRRRDLSRFGVAGAVNGPEGGAHVATSKRRRKQAGLPAGRVDDGWMVVDCRNFIVHIQDELTRRSIGLERLWGTDDDPIWRLDTSDEDAVDEYIANNPIPDDYVRKVLFPPEAGPVDIMPQFTRRSQSERWAPGKTRPGTKKQRSNRKKRK